MKMHGPVSLSVSAVALLSCPQCGDLIEQIECQCHTWWVDVQIV
jgi:hypothetical protein